MKTLPNMKYYVTHSIIAISSLICFPANSQNSNNTALHDTTSVFPQDRAFTQDQAELLLQAFEVNMQAFEAFAQASETAVLAVDAWVRAGGSCVKNSEDCDGHARYYQKTVAAFRSDARAIRTFVQIVQNNPTQLTDDLFLSISPSIKEQDAREQADNAKRNEGSFKDGADKARLAAGRARATQSAANAHRWTVAANAHDRASEAWAEAVAVWTLSAKAWKRFGEYEPPASLDLDAPVIALPRSPPLAALPIAPVAVLSPPPQEEENHGPEIFVIKEQMPELIGGMRSIVNKVEYPATCRMARVQGRVFLKFVVNEQGNVQDVVVTRGIGSGCDEAAVRAVSAARFKPGQQGGKPVKVLMSLPISFYLK